MTDRRKAIHRATIRDLVTNETRVTEHDLSREEGDGPPSTFWWTEGNAACDCNRGLFFYGDDLPEGLPLGLDGVPRFPCTGGRFRLVRLEIDGWLLVEDGGELERPRRAKP